MNIINALTKANGVQPSSNKNSFVNVLKQFKIKDTDAELFFDRLAIGDRIYFKEVLTDRYGKNEKVGGLTRRNEGDATALAAVKNKLLVHM